MRTSLLLFTLLTGTLAMAATDISLPKPQMTGGKPLMEVLATRKSTRKYDATADLTPEVLSSLLWAGNGVARDADHRTAPSAMNCREILLYVVRKDATYLYEPEANRLKLVKEGDFRAATGAQPFCGDAAINILLVADWTRMSPMNDENKVRYGTTDAAFVSENLYLYCASEGLATVVRGMFDGPALSSLFNLPETQKIILVQTVGYARP